MNHTAYIMHYILFSFRKDLEIIRFILHYVYFLVQKDFLKFGSIIAFFFSSFFFINIFLLFLLLCCCCFSFRAFAFSLNENLSGYSIPLAINPLVGLLKYPAQSPLQYFRPFPSILLLCRALGLLERKTQCASLCFGDKPKTVFKQITLTLNLFIINCEHLLSKNIVCNLAGILPSRMRSQSFEFSVNMTKEYF